MDARYFGTPEWIRTIDARFRKPTLYPLSYGSISAGAGMWRRVVYYISIVEQL